MSLFSKTFVINLTKELFKNLLQSANSSQDGLCPIWAIPIDYNCKQNSISNYFRTKSKQKQAYCRRKSKLREATFKGVYFSFPSFPFSCNVSLRMDLQSWGWQQQQSHWLLPPHKPHLLVTKNEERGSCSPKSVKGIPVLFPLSFLPQF